MQQGPQLKLVLGVERKEEDGKRRIIGSVECVSCQRARKSSPLSDLSIGFRCLGVQFNGKLVTGSRIRYGAVAAANSTDSCGSHFADRVQSTFYDAEAAGWSYTLEKRSEIVKGLVFSARRLRPARFLPRRRNFLASCVNPIVIDSS